MGRRRQLIWFAQGEVVIVNTVNELSGSLKCRGFLNQLTNYWLLKRRRKE